MVLGLLLGGERLAVGGLPRRLRAGDAHGERGLPGVRLGLALGLERLAVARPPRRDVLGPRGLVDDRPGRGGGVGDPAPLVAGRCGPEGLEERLGTGLGHGLGLPVGGVGPGGEARLGGGDALRGLGGDGGGGLRHDARRHGEACRHGADAAAERGEAGLLGCDVLGGTGVLHNRTTLRCGSSTSVSAG